MRVDLLYRLTACTVLLSVQMKKRLRAEIYASYIKMGQAGMNVDAELYQVVSERLSCRLLCGNHAQVSPSLPPRAERIKRTRVPRLMIDDSIIEAIVDEEPPSNLNWHRYLVRWRGYDPSWEAWRLPGRGAIGDPVESWEPAENLRGTRALAQWEEQRAQM